MFKLVKKEGKSIPNVLAHAYIRRSGFPNPKNMTGYTHKKEVIGSIFGSLSVAKTFTKECPKLSKDPLWC